MNNKQKRFFNVAREISFLSDFKRARIGAVVVEKNRIISTGHNSNKTSPVQGKYNLKRGIDLSYPPRVHAEIAALTPLINKKDVNWNHVSLYIYREQKDGKLTCAKPCKACQTLINSLGIKTIFYSDWDGNFVKETMI